MKLARLFIMTVIFSIAANLFGQEGNISTETSSLGHGYRAFAEINVLNNGGGLDISTTHGYQFDSNLYAGAGVSYGAVIGGYYSFVHAEIRYDFVIKEKVTPFADLRVSYNDGVIIQPAIGYRYKHLNVSARYWLNKFDDIITFSIGFDFGGRKKR